MDSELQAGALTVSSPNQVRRQSLTAAFPAAGWLRDGPLSHGITIYGRGETVNGKLFIMLMLDATPRFHRITNYQLL